MLKMTFEGFTAAKKNISLKYYTGCQVSVLQLPTTHRILGTQAIHKIYDTLGKLASETS